MREKFLIAIVIITAAIAEMFPGVSAQDAAAKAQQLIAQARAALGGDKLKSLSVTGAYRRTFGQAEITGEIDYDLLLPDKMMKTDTMNPMPSLEITRIEALNGDDVWEDQQQHGGGGGMVFIRRGPGGPGADPEKAQDMLRLGVRSDFARLLIGWLLTTPSSFPVEFSFAGEAESPDGKADVLDVKGPGKFAARLFLDQKTHYPLMLTYNGKKPRIITQTATAGAPRKPEEMEKRMKEMDAEADKQPDVEYRIYLSDYREVNGVSFPHKLTRSIENEVNEELEIKNVKINPQLKPEKFVKK
ncbi:MAG TPA: hypothetical protein VFV58_02230 [Blastocatellia bacterium]|jgi:hypothetical protein|nr:hypothetical protein [Blastocatellia bacterium]